MKVAPGTNSQTFYDCKPSGNIIQKIGAFSSEYGSYITFSVPSSHTESLRSPLDKIGIVVRLVYETSQTCFKVSGGADTIRLSLGLLAKEKYISTSLCERVGKQFPKAYGGTHDLWAMSSLKRPRTTTYEFSLVEPPQKYRLIDKGYNS